MGWLMVATSLAIAPNNSPAFSDFPGQTIAVPASNGNEDAGILSVRPLAARNFRITAAGPNKAPTIGAIANVNLNEDDRIQTAALTGISSGSVSENQVLTVSAISNNPGLIANPTVAYTSPNSTGTLSFTPVANASGTAVITVTVNDGAAANNIFSRTFTVTVSSVNDPPTLDAIANVTISEGALRQTVNLSGIGSGTANESQTLTVTATSGNTALIPNPTVAYTSPNTTGTLSFTPVANASGSVVITVTVNDGTAANNTFSRTFSVSITAVNKAPTIGAVANVNLNEDDPIQIVTLGGIGSGSVSENQVLSLSATSNNPGLIANPTVTYNSPNATGTLSFTPVANANGTAVITVTVDDAGPVNKTASTSFTVTVAAVNDAPALGPISDVSLSEDAGAQTVDLSAISSGAANESQTLTVTATSSNTALIPNPTVAYVSPSATGTLSFTPLANASGTAVITVTINDGAAANSVFSRTFTVMVTPVNDPPVLDGLSNISINEDAGLQTVNLTGIGPGAVNESQTLALSVTSSDPGLIPTPTISYASPAATGVLSFAPVANASGTAVITVTVNDAGAADNTVSTSFTVTVTPVNDPPTLDAIANVTISEGALRQTVNLSGIGSGGVNESQTLTVTATSSNTALIPNPAVAYTSPNATGSLSFTPAANASGTAVITVTVNDGATANNTFSRTFSVSFNAVNKSPTIGAIANVSVNEDDPVQTAALGGISSGSVSESQVLTVSATSNNPGLIANPTVTYASPNATGTLSFTPVANANGTALITVTVDDGGPVNNTTSTSFTVTVAGVNDLPTLLPISNLSLSEDAGAQTVSLSGIGSGAINESQTLTVTATSGNTTLIPNPTVAYTSPNSTGSLSFTPMANASGTAMITVTVNDGAAANNAFARTFAVTVSPVNDPPTLDALSSISIDEDAGLQTVNLTGIGSGAANESQTLALSVTSSDPGLIPTPTISYASPAATGTLSFAPVANGSGTAVITVTVNDGGAADNTVSTSFTVTVTPVNDPPTLDAIANVSISQGALSQTVNMSGIGSGGANESQTLTVTSASSNTALIPNPTVGYTSPNATGSLSFTPVANASGTVVITVTVNDGAAANNTFSRTFSVSFNAVNKAPTIGAIANVSVNEDDPVQTAALGGISSGSVSESQVLTVSATSNNPGLIANPTVTYASPNATGTLSFTPVANANGTALITVTVDDGGPVNNTTSTGFTVTVAAMNDAPTLGPISNVSLSEDAGAQLVRLSGISPGAANESQVLTVSASSNNPGLIPTPTLSYSSPNATATLSFKPVPNASGTAVITVTVNDGGAANNTFSRNFTVTVTPVNDPPTLDAIANVSLSEGAPPQTVILSGIGSGGANESQTLTVTATSGNTALIPNPEVSYTSPNTTGTLSLTPVANGSGTAVILVTVSDGAAANNTFSRTFTVTVPQSQAVAITCPANISTNICGDSVVVNFAAPTVTGGTLKSIVPASGSVFKVGTTMVTCTATDSRGATATCTFNVTVGQSQAVAITCPANISTNICGDSEVVNFAAPAVTGGTLKSIVPASGSVFRVGTTLVTCTATNACSTNTCTFSVTVRQSPAVAITCPGAITINSSGSSAVVNFPSPTVTGGKLERCVPASGSVFALGTTLVTCTATNACGVTSICTFNVTVVPGGQGTPCDVTSKGTNFWLTFPANYAPNPTNRPHLSLHLAGLANVQGYVTIPGLAFATNWTIPAAGVATVNLPWEADLGELNDGVTNKGVHVTAAGEIAVYALNYAPFTSDAYLALPNAALGTEYIVLGYPNVYTDVPELNGTQFAIVATEDVTTVTITPSVPTGVHLAGLPFAVTMNRGDTYQLRNTNDIPADLSGTIVTANKPIAVFGSHACANVSGTTEVFCDYLVEQLPPTTSWGTNFVAMPLATRLNGDTYRIVAAETKTIVRINGSVVATLDRGKVHEQIVTNSAHFTSDKPVLVAQYANSFDYDSVTNADPFMMLIPATKLFSEDYVVFSMTNGFATNFVNVVVPNSLTNQILLDGVPVSSSKFSPIPATGPSSGFSGAQLGVTPDKHTLTQTSPNRQPFGAIVYGFGQYVSYGYPAGISSSCSKECLSINCPPNIRVKGMEAGGQHVSFQVFGTNSCGGKVDVVCVPPSGSLFAFGTTVVQCRATDQAGATVSCSFSVLVDVAIVITTSTNGFINLAWSPGSKLQETTDLTGPFKDTLNAKSPYVVQPAAPGAATRRFFRVLHGGVP